MRIFNKLVQYGFYAFSLLSGLAGVYLWQQSEWVVMPFVLSLLFALAGYRLLADEQNHNSLDKLITRDTDCLMIKHLNPLPVASGIAPKKIEIARISSLTIGDQSLSVILDGNGNGYDFAINGCQHDIQQHLKQLLTHQELANIQVSLINS